MDMQLHGIGFKIETIELQFSTYFTGC